MEGRKNFSQKRVAVYDVLRNTTTHPTADWVHTKLRAEYPNISLGTVYRNLRQFCDEGQAVSLGVINGQERFDGDISPHAHLVCDKCGSVSDIHREFFDDASFAELSEKYEADVYSAAVVFRGICKNCKMK